MAKVTTRFQPCTGALVERVHVRVRVPEDQRRAALCAVLHPTVEGRFARGRARVLEPDEAPASISVERIANAPLSKGHAGLARPRLALPAHAGQLSIAGLFRDRPERRAGLDRL